MKALPYLSILLGIALFSSSCERCCIEPQVLPEGQNKQTEITRPVQNNSGTSTSLRDYNPPKSIRGLTGGIVIANEVIVR